MPLNCAVIGCRSIYKPGIRFFRLPGVKDCQGQECPKKKNRRNLWIAAMHRQLDSGYNFNHARICADHFISGEPADLNDTDSPDFVPSCNMASSKQKRNPEQPMKRHMRYQNPRNITKSQSPAKVETAFVKMEPYKEDDVDIGVLNSEIESLPGFDEIQIIDYKPEYETYMEISDSVDLEDIKLEPPIQSGSLATLNSAKYVHSETNPPQLCVPMKSLSVVRSALTGDPLPSDQESVMFSMSICRVCMQEGHPMISLDCFVSAGESSVSVEYLINTISCVKAGLNDGLPPGLCEQCLQRIFDAYQIKKLCESSNTTMLDMLEKIKQEIKLKVSKETNENQISISSKDSERIFCQECNITILKPDLSAHMMKCKMNTNIGSVTSKSKKILICRGCNYLVHPYEMNEHKKTCNREMFDEIANTASHNSTTSPVENMEDIISNISHDPFLVGEIESTAVVKIKEQVYEEFRKHKEQSKINNVSDELNKIGDNENCRDEELPIPESLIKLKKDIDDKFMKHKKKNQSTAVDAVLVKCTVCNTVLFQRDIEHHKSLCHPQLKKLWKLNEGEGGKYACTLCDKTYNLLESLRVHINQHHTLTAKILCSTCGKTVRKADWKSHENQHLGIKPFACDFCSQKFRVLSALQMHIRRHTQEKPYKCKFCPKSFCGHFPLTVHTRIHTGEKPYGCVVCDKRFTTRSNMQVHMKTHGVIEEKSIETDVSTDNVENNSDEL